ncbi:hypothetical protein MKX08_009419 [Trichoderma sp. CBMAI-0020]|nr:hypothetical protein MKX08_009419 [Trichoderma sp. CBMAI-0020]
MASRIATRLLLSPFSRAQFQRPSFIRTMATSGARRQYEFLVILPDKPGPEARKRRLEVRAYVHTYASVMKVNQHFKDMTPTLDGGKLKMGGAILHDVPVNDEAENMDFAGSVMILVAESAEEAKNMLKEDVYVKADVWDFEKTQIYPLKCGFRFPL